MTTDQLHEATDKLNRLVTSMLDDAAGSPEVSKQSVNTREVVDGVLAVMDGALREKGFEVKVFDLPTVQANRTMIEQVFQNLVDNAVAFARTKPTLSISCDRRGDEWVFRVKDNGIGIEHEDLHRVFLPSRRRNLSARPESGVGLSVSKRVVERHHGHISVHSTPGKGTTFYFTLPA